ncbi:MAG TPA: histidine phosphatase family protein [Pseudonocardia sp.]|nr:histidine phosphatase family protein [Pseudonocardia sp.]
MTPIVYSHRDGFQQRPFALPDGATEILLVRHGASQNLEEGKLFELHEGHGNPHLSPEGEAQAQLIGKRLENEKPDKLFVTPLRRTHETAAPFVASTGMSYTIIPELIEVYLGEWEGGEFRRRSAAGDPIALKIFDEQRWDVIPGAEPAEDFAKRIRAGIDRIVAETGPNATAAAVLHGAAIGEVCRQATDSRRLAFVHSDNASVSRLIIYEDGRWMLRSFNDISHLSAG